MNVQHLSSVCASNRGSSDDLRRPPKADLRAPHFATWTVLLFVACWILWLGVIGAVVTGWISIGWGCFFSTIASFLAFTPMHDASHKSIARKKWINQWIGRLSAWLLAAPFGAFRFVHLEHHKHTNHEEKDPDYWSGKGPFWFLPFRWLTQDLHYYVIYIRRWDERPQSERREVACTVVLLVMCAVLLWILGWGSWAFWLWLLPARLATALLAYGFDYLPHTPHQIRASEDRYKATIIRPESFLTPLLVYQNYHLIHHLYPGVPFYRYGEVWKIQKEYLVEKGAEMRSWRGETLELDTSTEDVHVPEV